ncbi:aconitate hydratase [Salinispira pacifica]|nr:aconitate hydratase [Salinispira pacifica]
MALNLAQKLISEHLVEGSVTEGQEIGLKIDQTLTQDATGTLVMLEFEAMGIPRVETEVSVQYVDHNLMQLDNKNQEDHIFLKSACEKFGIWFSRPGNGVSHPVHMERFGIPGKTLLGSDSHSCAAGSLGMLAMGAGGLEVAMAMAGKPFYVTMPRVMGVRLAGSLPPWVSAKDVILEMLRRHGVKGGTGKIIEYYGPGLEHLSAMDRHVIANMGAELGATATVFPSDDRTREFLAQQDRVNDWRPLEADKDAAYDEQDEIDLSALEPLIALPVSPGNVVPVSQVAGKEIHQAYIGSSANPGFRDFAIAALILQGRSAAAHVSLDINPSSRDVLENLSREGYLNLLIKAGARIHQTGCNGCIGMGQAPASGKISLRTVPRNFPGRSGTKEDQVHLCSPETAAVSAIQGKICDPRNAGFEYPPYKEPEQWSRNTDLLLAPRQIEQTELEKGQNIQSLPDLDPLPDEITAPVILKTGDDISTDEILPAGARVLPFRSNIPKISEFTFSQLDEQFYRRALDTKEQGSIIVGGANYGQGSSREHAALAPRYLGVRIVIAKSFARIHWQNLANFGILALTFSREGDYDRVSQGDTLSFRDLRAQLLQGGSIRARINGTDDEIILHQQLSERQIEMVLAGSLISLVRRSA